MCGFGDVEVVGETLYQANILRAIGGVHRRQTEAVLVPEPTNTHDRYAVRVDLLAGESRYKAGYLPREMARGYHEVLQPLAEDGAFAVVSARLWKGDLGYQVYLHLDSPDRILPLTVPDPEGVVLLAERETAVIDEGHHQDLLAAIIGRRRKPVGCNFQLRPSVVPRGKNTGKDSLAVWSEGGMVGRLTPLKTAEYWTACSFAWSRGLTVYATGWIEREDERGLQVTLLLPIPKYMKGPASAFYRDPFGADALS